MVVSPAPALPTTESLQTAIEKRTPRGRALTLPWLLFLVIGLPLGVMAALSPLASAGIYVDALRPLWRPWPPDPLKPFLGASIFTLTLVYLAYKSGRIRGFHSGKVAATAAFRNLVERRGSRTKPGEVRALPIPSGMPALSTPVKGPAVPPDPPAPPPEEAHPSTPPPLELPPE